MRVVYQYGKSHISGGVRRSYRKRPCPEMTSPEAALNGSDVTGRGPDAISFFWVKKLNKKMATAIICQEFFFLNLDTFKRCAMIGYKDSSRERHR
jgi:hypothetical protein